MAALLVAGPILVVASGIAVGAWRECHRRSEETSDRTSLELQRGGRRPNRRKSGEQSRTYQGGPASEDQPPSFLEAHLDLVNIGVVGLAGSGRSSFVNAARKVKSGQNGSAKDNDQTTEPVPYSFRSFMKPSTVPIHIRERAEIGFADAENLEIRRAVVVALPQHPGECLLVNVDGVDVTIEPQSVRGVSTDSKLWDLPALENSSADYVWNMGLRFFDMVLLITSDSYTEEEKEVMRELQQAGVPFLLVRTKIDAFISMRIAEEEDEDELAADRKREIEDDVKREMQDYFTSLRDEMAFLPTEHYVISAVRNQVSRHDFPKLHQDLESALASRLLTLG